MTKIQLIRNATMRIEYGGKIFLTDPLFADKAALTGFLYREKLVNPTVSLPIPYQKLLEDIDGIIVSHTHIPSEDKPSAPSDHFDPIAINVIKKSTPIYVQTYDQKGLERVGFTNITPIDQSINIDDIKMTRITGRHVDIDQLLPMIGQSSGYVLEKDGCPTILWTGDTLLTNELKLAIRKHQPEIIITHSGGAQLPIDDEGNVATLLLDAKSTIDIAVLAPQAKIIAIHLEALDHCTVTRKNLRNLANASNISIDQMLIPNDGDVLEL